MKVARVAKGLCALALAFGTAVSTPASLAQSDPQATVPAQASPLPGTASAPPAAKKRRVRRTIATQTIPIEAPGTQVQTPLRTPEQRAADQRLLEQQQAQSAQAARVTDQQVRRAQQQHDAIQNETRIQDAPGPAQTGVVPAAGPPVAPANTDTRIQDAPGPAQTLPQTLPTQPASTPAQTPQQTPQQRVPPVQPTPSTAPPEAWTRNGRQD